MLFLNILISLVVNIFLIVSCLFYLINLINIIVMNGFYRRAKKRDQPQYIWTDCDKLRIYDSSSFSMYMIILVPIDCLILCI
jgi:hypothetical protein